MRNVLEGSHSHKCAHALGIAHENVQSHVLNRKTDITLREATGMARGGIDGSMYIYYTVYVSNSPS